MIYSLFDYDTRKYTYYDAPGTPPATGSFRMPSQAMLPESILARLPAGAVQVGEPGDLPKGVVCTSDASLAGLSGVDGAEGGFPWMLAIGTFLGFKLGRAVQRRQR